MSTEVGTGRKAASQVSLDAFVESSFPLLAEAAEHLASRLLEDADADDMNAVAILGYN